MSETQVNKYIYCWSITILFLLLSPSAQGQPAPARERLSINEDWRFQKGDPAVSEDALSYAKIKDWVNVTGNEFVKSETGKRNRPTGNPGETVSYAGRDFD